MYFHRILTRSLVIEVLQHPQHTYEHWAIEHLEVQHMNLKQFYVAKFAIKEAELQKFTQNVFVHFDIWVNWSRGDLYRIMHVSLKCLNILSLRFKLHTMHIPNIV